MKLFLKFSKSIIVLLCLVSCNTADYKSLTEASNEIATYCGTQNVQVSTSSGYSTEKDMNAYTITIGDIKVPDNYPLNRIASHSAKLLYDKLNKEQRKDKNIIRVTISLSGKSETNDYKMADLASADKYINKGRLMLDYIKKADYSGLKQSLEPKYFTEDNYNKFQTEVLEKNKATFAKIDSIIDDGFYIEKIDGKSFVTVYSHTPIDSLNIMYRFTFDSKRAKLAGMEVR